MRKSHQHKKGEECATCVLDRTGLRVTKQRQILFEILTQEAKPLTAEQIFYLLKSKNVEINLSTVYRILEHFSLKEIVRKTVLQEEGKAYFELTQKEHGHHLICTECKKIMTIAGCPLDSYAQHLEKTYGYKISGHKLEIYGLCPDCKSQL